MSLEIRCRLDRPGPPPFTLEVDLELPASGITTLWGPSGCGKTTLLRCLAGLERGATGRIALGGAVWLDSDAGIDRPPHRRALGFVFQEGLLFPHLDVRGNLLFGWKRAPHRRRIGLDQAVALLGLAPLLDRYPAGLSGGERQRVALGRALLAGPDLILLDEPLASVDQKGRTAVYPFVADLGRQVGVPILHVTHDAFEAARLADQAAIMNAGKVTARGPLAELMTDLDLEWAGGDQAAAVVRAQALDRDAKYHLNRLEFPGGELWLPGPALPPGQEVRVLIAARDVSLALSPPADSSILNVLPVAVEEYRPRNESQVVVKLRAVSTPLLAVVTRRSAAALQLHPGQRLYAQVKSVALI